MEDITHRGRCADLLMGATGYLRSLMYFGCNVCFVSLPLFVPNIASEMGSFTQVQSNGLTVIPYIVCWVAIVACAFIFDRLRLPGPFGVGITIIAAIGYILLTTQPAIGARYLSRFFTRQIFLSVAILIFWVSNMHARLQESRRVRCVDGAWTVWSCSRDQRVPVLR